MDLRINMIISREFYQLKITKDVTFNIITILTYI